MCHIASVEDSLTIILLPISIKTVQFSMKPLKVILPDIYKKSIIHNSKSKRKFFRAWPMRDTFTNWEKISRKDSKLIEETASQNSCQEQKKISNDKKRRREASKQSTCGITLEQYFREAAFTLPNENEYHAAEESILPYIEHNFLIHQADEDGLSESENCKKGVSRVPFRDEWIEKGSFTKELRSSVGYSKHKLKTQHTQQDTEFQRMGPYASKKNVMTICRSKDKLFRMQQSFQLKQTTDRHKHPLNHLSLKGKNSSRQIIGKVGLTTKQNKSYNIEAVTKSAMRLKLKDVGYKQRTKIGKYRDQL